MGSKRKFKEAYHPVVFISGPEDAPYAVILTHSSNFPCNFKLYGNYGEQSQCFVAHLIEKMSEWGSYKKIGELSKKDVIFVENHISVMESITWKQYRDYAKNGCPNHKANT